MYYNYHGILINKIKNGELISYEFVDSYHGVDNVLLLYFEDGSIKFVREYQFVKYLLLIQKYQKKDNT